MTSLFYPLIYLTGLPGSGKSFWGRQLARKLNYRFIDTDSMIEEKAGCSVSDLFRIEGETSFREQEHLVFLQTLAMSETVVATGGGLPCFYNHANELQNHLAIFLDLPLEKIEANIAKTAGQRPLLKGKQANEYLKTTYKERLPYYKKAQVHVSRIDIELLVNACKLPL